MSLVEYSASSDSGDSEKEQGEVLTSDNNTKKRCLLPPAKTLLSSLPAWNQRNGKVKGEQVEGEDDNNDNDEEEVVDDPASHEGRLRSFKHERGNWATHVYIPVAIELFEDLQDAYIEKFKGEIDFKRPDAVHISLSKTIILRHHQITPFVSCIEQTIKSLQRFRVYLANLEVLTNEEKTRTFLTASTVDAEYIMAQLSTLGNRIDRVMKDFQLSTFYENPLFHCSFLWCLGDKSSVIKSRLEKLPIMVPVTVEIDRICCKSGYKEYTFCLK